MSFLTSLFTIISPIKGLSSNDCFACDVAPKLTKEQCEQSKNLFVQYGVEIGNGCGSENFQGIPYYFSFICESGLIKLEPHETIKRIYIDPEGKFTAKLEIFREREVTL